MAEPTSPACRLASAAVVLLVLIVATRIGVRCMRLFRSSANPVHPELDDEILAPWGSAPGRETVTAAAHAEAQDGLEFIAGDVAQTLGACAFRYPERMSPSIVWKWTWKSNSCNDGAACLA